MRSAICGVVALLALAACAEPRPAALKGKICDEVYARNFEPYPRPEEIRADPVAAAPPPIVVTVPTANRDFRSRLADRYVTRRFAVPAVRVLAISAGGAWGAFSAGFVDGWGHNPGEQRPKFDVVTGVSTGSMLAPAVFLGRDEDLRRLRAEYRSLRDQDVFAERSSLGLLTAVSLYDTAPLRRKVESILDEEMVEAIAQQAPRRTLAVMAVNLDSSLPEVFDLTEMAASPKPIAERRRRMVDAIMASAAIPIGFPPVFIDGNMYVDGGVRAHAFAVQEGVTALRGTRIAGDARSESFRVTSSGIPIRLSVVVSGDMKVMPECVGSKRMGFLDIAKRTASVVTDQLLRDSVDLLLRQVGQRGESRARFIDASSVVTYTSPQSGVGPVTSEGKCVVPSDNDDQFYPPFQQCLDAAGYALGQTAPIPWRTRIGAPP